MSDSEESSSENEESLHEYVDVAFTLEEALNPTQEQTLHATLDQLAGVKSASLIQKTATVHYDPTETAQKKIAQAIEGAGFRIADALVTPASAMTDALRENLTHAEEPPGEAAR